MNVAKVLEIIRMPDVTEPPESQHPCVLGAFNLRHKGVAVGADDQISKPEVGQLARRAAALITRQCKEEAKA